MQLKKAKWILDGVKGFSAAKIQHEQYMTPSELCSAIVHSMHGNGDVHEKRVLDFGCGTGMLTAGCLLYGAKEVVGVDIDADAKEIYDANIKELEETCDMQGTHCFVVKDVLADDLSYLGEFDVAIVNPPFGTKNNKGIDVFFLEKALSLAKVVYSIHKTSTREYFLKKYKGHIRVLSEMKFEIGKTYRFHKKDAVDINVDLFRTTRK